MINELTSEILFRCPSCQKLYQTDKSDLRSLNLEKKIEFQCESCQEDFFLTDELSSLGVYSTYKKSNFEFIPCLKCQALKPKNQDECLTCGVFQSKFTEINKLESPRLYELNNIWNKVVLDFDNDSVHQHFLNHAQKLSALNFAAQKYFEIEKIIGKNINSEKYLKQIELRLSTQLSAVQPSVAEKPKKDFFNFKESFFGLEYNSKNILLVVSFLGATFFIFNILKPIWPSVNGLVLAFVALSVGLWSLSKNSSKDF